MPAAWFSLESQRVESDAAQHEWVRSVWCVSAMMVMRQSAAELGPLGVSHGLCLKKNMNGAWKQQKMNDPLSAEWFIHSPEASDIIGCCNECCWLVFYHFISPSKSWFKQSSGSFCRCELGERALKIIAGEFRNQWLRLQRETQWHCRDVLAGISSSSCSWCASSSLWSVLHDGDLWLCDPSPEEDDRSFQSSPLW